MKNLWIAVILLLLSFGVKSQSLTTPPITYTPMTAGGYVFKYLKADSGFNVPNRDTSYGRGTRRGGSIVFDSVSHIFYGWNGQKWSPFGSGAGGGSIDSITIVNNNFCIYIGGVQSCITLTPDTVYVADDLYVVWDSTGHQVIHRLRDDGLISGGVVTGAGGMNIDITITDYIAGGKGVEYLTAQTTKTIAASDPTLNRYDLIVVDTFGQVVVIPGIPAINPLVPGYDPGSQVPLTSIYIPAGATSLPINQGMIYNENVEWTTGSAGTVTVDYNNTDNPYLASKAAYVSSYTFGSNLSFTDSGPDTLKPAEVLKFFIYLNVPFNGSLQVQFFNGATPVSSRQAVSATDGFNPFNTVSYQNVSITLANFQTPPTIWDKLFIYPSGSDLSGVGGFYIDAIQLQYGLTPQGKAYVDSVSIVSGSDYYWKNGTPTLIGVRSAGGNQNLDQVAHVGNSTDTSLISTEGMFVFVNGSTNTIPGSMGITDVDNFSSIGFATAQITGKPKIFFTNPNGGGNTVDIFADNISPGIARSLQIPDSNGVFALSVNNVFADTKGNITLPSTAIDTTNKFVNNVTKNATADSIYVWKGTGYTAFKDSVGINTLPVGVYSPATLNFGAIINIFGDSYGQAQGATNTSYGYVAIVNNSTGTTANNLSVGARGGKVAATSAYTNIPVNNGNPTIYMATLNDARRAGSNTALPAKTAEKIKSCLRATIANNTLLSAVAANNASVTASGAWTTTSGIGDKASSGLGGLVRVSAAAGNTLTYTFTGSTLVIGTFSTDQVTTTGGDWTYSIDGGIYTGTYTGKNKTDGISDGVTDNSICPNAVVINNLGAGSHTIVVTASAINARIDYFGILQPVQASPSFIVSSTPKMSAAGYATLNGSDAVWNQADSVQKIVIAEFYNYPVFYADVNKYYQVPLNVGSDNVHPNDTGYAEIAQGILSVVNKSAIGVSFSTGLTRTNNIVTANLSTGVSGGQSVIGGTVNGQNLTLSSTSAATKGKILFGTSAYDENLSQMSIGVSTPIASVFPLSVQTSSTTGGIAVNAQTTGYPTYAFYIDGTLKSFIAAARTAGDVFPSTPASAAGDLNLRTQGATNINFGNSSVGMTFQVGTTGILSSWKMLKATGTPTVVTHQTDSTISQMSISDLAAAQGAVTQTLTNKRITARYASTTSSATPTINTDNVDTYELTAQAADITSFTTNLSGTPTVDQILHIIITGTAARAITWGASFESSTVALPTTTVTTARLDVYFVWNATTSKWRCGGVW